jgi:Na+-driven multidrug efflux pump
MVFDILLGIATSVRVGQNVGGGRTHQAITAGWSGILLVVGFMSATA